MDCETLPNLFIINLLSNYIPTENIEVDTVYDKILCEYNILLKIPNMRIVLRITKRTKWFNIKKYIDNHHKRNTEKRNTECEICDGISLKFASCVECYNRLCVECYNNIIKSNNGIFKCPYCRYSYGLQFRPVGNTD